jgi:anthranilate synthase/aminodeoxychorismate synthase-like glutamine amidotransferase
MILVIDNYDSFTYNLVQLIGSLNTNIMVKRNDDLTVAEIEDFAPSGILVSPGPGRPEQAGISMDVVKLCGKKIPVLGVCLGHQAIGAAFGGHIVHAPSLMHGRTSNIYHDGRLLFDRVPTPFVATRYHSLVISPDGFPPELEVTARTDDGVIMGVRHRIYPVEGVQFHPESVLTTEGPTIIRNWLKVQQCI